MKTKIKDLTREFSEIEVNIIKEFGQKISADKIELHRISQIGSSSYWLIYRVNLHRGSIDESGCFQMYFGNLPTHNRRVSTQ